MPAHPEKFAKTQRLRAILPNNPRCRPVSGGLLLSLLIGVAVFLGFTALLFSRSASQARYFSFRHDQRRWLNRWVEMASDEAIARLEADVKKAGHPARECLLHDPPQEFAFDLPLTTDEIMRRGGLRAGEVQATAVMRPLDRRTTDSVGNRFFTGEAVGTLEIAATISFSDGKRRGRTLRRHYPWRVTSLAHPRTALEPRERYYGAFLQDYVLFVRDGLNEFRQTRGASLHAPLGADRSLRLELAHLPPEQRGKVFFGGTRDPEVYSSARPGETPYGNYVFLNVPASAAFLLPENGSPWQMSLPLTDILRLVPRFAPFKDGLQGLQGSLCVQPLPVVEKDGTQEAIPPILLTGLEGAERNLDAPCLLFEPEILASPQVAGQVLEGALRQRFLYQARLSLDFSRLGTPLPSTQGIPASQDRLEFDFGRFGAAGGDPEMRALWQRLQTWNQERLGPLSHAGNADFLLCGGQKWSERRPWAAFSKPRLYNSRSEMIDARETGTHGLRPFNHFNLIHRDLQSGQTLSSLGILHAESRELLLNGVVWAGDYLELGDGTDQPLTIKGQGVLLARSIRLRCGLRKAGAMDICVLVARDGPIRIDTEDEIQAALVAVNDRRDGRVIPRRRLRILGSLAVDRLTSSYDPITGQIEMISGPSDWVVRYDPVFRPQQPQLQVALARWVLFERREDSP